MRGTKRNELKLMAAAIRIVVAASRPGTKPHLIARVLANRACRQHNILATTAADVVAASPLPVESFPF